MENFSFLRWFARIFMWTTRGRYTLKKCCFSLILASLTLLSTEVLAAQSLFKLSFKSTPLKEVMREIERQSEYSFLYNGQFVNVNKSVSIQGNGISLENTLKTLFKGTGIQYKIVDNQIILSDKDYSQQKERLLTGKVTDNNGEPLPGVSVVVKGTTNGVITDFDGIFSIKVSGEAKTLFFSFVGMSTKEVVIGKKIRFDIALQEDMQGLEEVVVVGYGVQKKANLSGAVATVSAKTLESRPITTVGGGLQGAISNLNITPSSGQATDAPKFNVRGITSLDKDGNAVSGSPLILVDGVPVTEGELARLNPNDISNVSVLKDAASAAIYGARAAFGVVLITTKEGKSEDLKVTYNNNFNTRTLTRIPKVVTDPYLVMEYKDVMAAPWYDLYKDADFDYGKRRSEDPSLPAAIPDPENPSRYKYYGATDWFHEVYNDYASSQSHNISLSKNTDKVNLYFSGEYFRQNGMLKYGNDIYDRYNFRGKVDFKMTSWLHLKTNTSYNYSTYDEAEYGGWSFFHNVNRTNPLDIPKNPDGSWTSTGASLIGSLQDGGRKNTYTNDFQTSLSFEANLIKDLWAVKGDATFRRRNIRRHAYNYPIAYKKGPEMALESSGKSWASESSGFTKYNVFNIYTDLKKKIGGHFITAMVGYNQEYKNYNYFWASRDDLISTDLPSMQLATGEKNIEASGTDWAVRGVFYRLNYIFKDRYIFETNGRYDGTSRFPKDDRFGFFPSASAAWVISEEGFFEPIKPFIDHFKLRASYGSLGNQNVNDYSYIPEMSAKKIGPILEGEQPVKVNPPGLVSGSLTWESVSTINGGVDLAFLGGRLNTSLDVFRRETKDMLTKGKTLPDVLGTDEPKENAADLETKGWELTMSWHDDFDLAGKPFRYDVRFVLADSRSYITKFDNPDNTLYDHYVGKEIGEIWGLTTEGLFQSNQEVADHADQKKVASYPGTRPVEAGDVKFKDIDGNEIIDWGKWTLDEHGDYSIIGNSAPRYNFSLDLSANWNNFDVRMYFQGVGKRDYYPGAGNHYFWGVYAQPWANVLESHLDHWTPENPNAYFPRLKSYTAESSKELGIAQTRYMQNAAYMRMKNLTVGYTLPKDLTQRINIDRLRFFLSGENLFEITELSENLDPEALGGTVYPFQRTYSIGLNLNF